MTLTTHAVTENARDNAARVSLPVRLARVCAITAGLIGLAGFLGWVVDSALLKSIVPGAATMKVNTALALMLGSAAVALTLRATHNPRRIDALAAALAALGAVTLLQYLFGIELGIDELLFADTATATTGGAHPGRMAVVTALCFTLLGVALLGRDSRGDRPFYPSQWLALIVFVLAYTAVLGYVLEVQPWHDIRVFGSMAIHTAFALLLLAGGVLLAYLPRGFTAVIAAGVGARLFWRLAPVALLGPPAIVALVKAMVAAGHVAEGFGFALAAMLMSLAFAAAVYRTAGAVAAVEALRRRIDTAEQIQQRLHLAMSTAHMGLLYWRLDTQRMELDRASCARIGFCLEADDELMRDPALFVHPDDLPTLLAARSAYLDQGTPLQLDLRIRNVSDAFVYVRLSAILDESAATPTLLCNYIDISAQKTAQLQADALAEQMQSLLDSLPEIVLSFDSTTSIAQLHVPSAPAPAFALPDWQGREYAAVFPGPIAAALDSAMIKAFGADSPETEHCQLELAGDTRYYRVTVNRLQGKQHRLGYFLGVIADETDVQQTRARLAALAFHDTLTGLPNRRLFEAGWRKPCTKATAVPATAPC